MSRLYSSFRKTLETTSISACLVSFLFFVIMWGLGYTFGVLMMVLGLGDKLRECFMGSNRDKEMEEIVARMNKEGPNN